MADPFSFAVLSMTTSLAGLLMRGAAVAVDPSWGSAASLPSETLNAWRSLRRLQQGRGGQENPLEASIKSRLQWQVHNANEWHETLARVSRSALAEAITEMEVALKELSRDDATVLEAVRFPNNFETYLRQQTAGHRRYVETAAKPFFDDLTRIVADEFIHLAPGSRGFDIAALKQLLTGQEQLLAGQEQLLEGQTQTNDRVREAASNTKTMTSDIKEIHSAVTRNQFILPKRIHFGYHPRVTTGFVKREGQDELFDAVFTHAEPKTVLTGTRGSGKTQLAAAVATRCEEEGWPLVAWIDAESRDKLIANLYNLALQAGIDAPKDVPPKNIVRQFLYQLSSAETTDGLFVFDNVENLDDLIGFTPEGRGVRVIVTTTRHLDWDSLGWLPLTVGTFEREQSITLLCERTGDTHRDTADQIADALGDLPVAVIQAATTAKSGRYSLSNYLKRLSNHPLKSSINRLEDDDYPDAVSIALFLAYEQVLEQIRATHPQQEKIAISLLDTLSLLAASGVPTHWLLALEDDFDAVRDTLSFLKRSSILQESIDGNKTIIHRLQGQVYRATYLSSQEKFSEALTYTITVLNKVKIESIDNFEDQRQEVRDIVEQIGTVTSQSHSHPLFSNPTFVSVLAMALHHAADLGMPQSALTLASSVTQASDILGPDHPDTLRARNNLAGAYQDAGRFNDAIALCEQTLEDRTRILEPNHPDTLTSRNILAHAYWCVGRFNDAIPLLEQTLEDRTHMLGPNHPDTLTSRIDLASTYWCVGRFNDAIALYEQTLEDRTRILGPTHPDTLTSRIDLAHAYQDAGRLNDAIPLLEQTLEDRTRILGPNHPSTRTSRIDLAHAYRDAGRLNDAIALCEQHLKDCTHILGPTHPDTFTSRNVLASTYWDAGRLNDAIALYEQNLEDRTRILGRRHPRTLISRNNLTGAYLDAGRLSEAIPLLEQTLEDSTHILGTNHPSTLISRNNLANAYLAAGRSEEARKLFGTP